MTLSKLANSPNHPRKPLISNGQLTFFRAPGHQNPYHCAIFLMGGTRAVLLAAAVALSGHCALQRAFNP